MPRKKLSWINETRKLSDLIPWEHNPRLIKEQEAKRLLESLEEFGQIQTLAIGPGNEVYDGHQRKLVWGLAAKYGEDLVVDVRVSNRALTPKERKKLPIILHRGATGEMDFDILANEYEVSDLTDWGFTPYELFGKGFDIDTELDFNKEWEGMPDFDNPENPLGCQVISVHFETPADVEAFAELLDQKITDKTKSLWYPFKERENIKELAYADES